VLEKPVPPTAQATIQEAAVAAGNLVAELMDAQPRQFVYHPLGMLVDLGSRFAVSQVLNRRLSGGIAQALWRAILPLQARR